MSVPPNAPPPGGYYYTTPPPPANNNGGCLKAAGITCGVLLLLGVIVGVLGVVAIKKQLAHPDKSSPFGVVVIVAKVSPEGVAIHRAIMNYHNKTGKYPPNLQALVPDYLPDGKILHNELDTNPSPGHITWQYTRPEEGAGPKTPVLRLPYEINMSSGNGRQTSQRADVVINLDGSTASNSSSYSSSGGGMSTVPGSAPGSSQ